MGYKRKREQKRREGRQAGRVSRMVYWLVLCVNLTQAGVTIEKGALVGEMPP